MPSGITILLACSVISSSLLPHGLQPTRLLCPWDSPSKNTGVGCHFLLQGIFLTQGSNPHLLHLLPWQILYHCVNQEPLRHIKFFISRVYSYKLQRCGSGSSVSLPHSASSLILINCLVGKPEGVALSCRVNIQVSVAAVCL